MKDQHVPIHARIYGRFLCSSKKWLETAGIRCEPTAYPLICSTGNRIDLAARIEVDPGSYLLVLRRDGFEDQRFPFVVPRLGEKDLAVSLLPSGSTPEGFLYIPAGEFAFAGDPAHPRLQ